MRKFYLTLIAVIPCALITTFIVAHLSVSIQIPRWLVSSSFPAFSLKYYRYKNAIQSAQKMDSAFREDVRFDFQRNQALNDPDNRVSKDFKVPRFLKLRTSFWFDVYTKYTKNQHIIHHARFPWLIYEIVDADIYFKSTKGPSWLKTQRGLDEEAQEQLKIKNALRRLIKKTHFKKLDKYESMVFRTLKSVPGSRHSVFKDALKNVRSQLGQKEFFMDALERSTKYLPSIEKEFAQKKLPLELTRIPFVESSFNVQAESKVGASGIWQIMPATGKSFGRVGKYIDERNNPLKASRMAATILKRYYHSLKSWPLAVTAYNNGIGNIAKALDRAQSKHLGRIIMRNHKGSFKFASSNFYACFLAALHAQRYREEIFNHQKFQYDNSLRLQAVKLNTPLDLLKLSRLTGMSLEKIIEHNLDLKKVPKNEFTLPKNFEVFIPSQKTQSLSAKYFQI